MRKLLSLFTIIVSTILVAQNAPCNRKVSGVIRDIDSGEVLPFASVKIQDTNNGVISDANGKFTITQICNEEIHFEVRFVGYKTVIHHHDFHHSDPVIYMASDETLLESVIVEESRVDKLQTISTQKKEINKLELINSSIGDLTKELSGVSSLQTGSNVSKPMIHGLHSNRVLVINDGVRHSYQVWGNEHAPEIDPSHVDQIEVVKGAATVKYGPEALGGVILYNSKKPVFDRTLNGSAGTSFQTNGRAIRSQVNLGEGYHRFAWDIGAFGVIQGDQKTPDYNLSNTGKREAGLSFNTLLHQPKFDLQVSGSYLEQQLGILRASIVGSLGDLQEAISDSKPEPTFPFTYSLQNPRQFTRHGIVKSHLAIYHGDHIFKFQYAFQRNDRKEFALRRGRLNNRPVIDLKLFSHSLESEWIQPEKEQWKGNSGIQLYHQNSINAPGSNPVNFVPDYKTLNVGIFTIQSIDFNNTTLEMGARLDFQSLSVSDSIRDVFSFSNQIKYTNGTISLGLRKQLNEYVTIFSNLGSAWRPPNVAELYSFGYHHSRVQYGLWRYNLEPEISTPEDSVFNQSLRPVPAEIGIKWISGIELKKSKMKAEFIFYANRINNFIFLRPYGITTGIADAFPFFIYDQTDAFFIGSDMDLIYDHSKVINSEVRISFVHARGVENQQVLPDIPAFNINYNLALKKEHWNYGLKIDYTSRQWNAPSVIEPRQFANSTAEINRDEIFDFMTPPAGYILFGGLIGYQKNRWNSSFQIHNLFNSSYRVYTDRIRYFADAPGRNFAFSVEYNF
ncbi:MAG: TonB-dependent receptor [Ekhidna sp.]